ncbi:aspartyl protease family protein At5g10770-like [Phoenix dactylifera]|uniref:Aspartyl protease family protein At5g10770-like n=1 Tax=Phoenix dactylifera TaxID=42345 RepID=A0A8B7BHT7_PHODC|nr:aspartyl protease family protein At5g10770-like [Phoenix dactylifera]
MASRHKEEGMKNQEMIKRMIHGSNNSRLTVVHRHGPCSPLGRWKHLNHHRLLRQDQYRVQSLHHRLSFPTASKPTKLGTSLAGVTTPSRSGIPLGTGNYIITVGFGTPKRDFTVIFDTGSDLTWIQCEPCVKCYAQNETLFDPSQSSTYSNIPCSSSDCSLPSGQTDCDSSNDCRYVVEYGDRSSSVGILAQETLTLTLSDVLTDFRFGCGGENEGLFGRAAGLIGLGRGEVSLVSQSAEKYGGVFSYCLPSRSSSTGYLMLGAATQTPNIKFTTMPTESYAPSFYFVELTGLTVGGRDLSIASSVFSNVGTIIDSGTVITRLPMQAYTALRSEFRQHMTKYQLVQPFVILDTCYNFTGYNHITIPAVVLQFSNGVSLYVDASGILYFASLSQACLAFAGNDDENAVSIVGNMQQRTFNVVYDVPNGRIGFGSGGCG